MDHGLWLDTYYHYYEDKTTGDIKNRNIKGKKPKNTIRKEELEVTEAKDKPGKGSGKKDACYRRSSLVTLAPSAYASGALVKCRKAAANWGKSEEFEMNEEWVAHKSAEWFVEQGLNEDGVDILIDEMGLQEFAELVYELGETEMLSEARAGGARIEPVNKSGKRVADLTKGAKTRAINTSVRRSKQRAVKAAINHLKKAALQSQSKATPARKRQNLLLLRQRQHNLKRRVSLTV